MKTLLTIITLVFLTGCDNPRDSFSSMSRRYTSDCQDSTFVSNYTKEGDVKSITLTCKIKTEAK